MILYHCDRCSDSSKDIKFLRSIDLRYSLCRVCYAKFQDVLEAFVKKGILQ